MNVPEDELSKLSPFSLKKEWLRLAHQIDHVEASGSISERAYRRLLTHLYRIDRELNRRGIVWGY